MPATSSESLRVERTPHPSQFAMYADTHSIGKIFGQDRRYLVPLFQRPYVWKEGDQWEPLWDDVRTVAERLLAGKKTRPHFLGAIVLDLVHNPTGHIETRLVIDGQQRLTTLQLMLEAFADFAREVKQEQFHKALLKLTRNDDPLSTDPDDVFKVWPTNLDQDLFGRVMRERSPAAVRAHLKLKPGKDRAGKPIPDAYFFFYEMVSAWIADGTSGFEFRLDALYRAMKDFLRLVVIDLGEDDDAQLIFETLNARGTPLLPSDLVKNHLFHMAQLEDVPLQPLYDKFWKPFDAEADHWRGEIGKGRGKRPRIDLFLQDYLTLQQRDDVKIAQLYNAYRDHLGERAEDGVARHMERLADYAGVYRSFDAFPKGSPEAIFFDRLRALEMTTAHPFLLELFHRHGANQTAVREILRDIESFVVRRMLCRLTTKPYNRFFIDVLKILEQPTTTVATAFRTQLAASDAETQRWPKDDEVRQAWLEDPLGKSLPRSRVEMVILALEDQARSNKTERIGGIEDKLTIEHLMPRQWERHWPLPDGLDPDEAGTARSRVIQTIGNLTLLTKNLNPSVSNAAWAKKREAILEHSVLKLNNKLGKEAVWNEVAIRRRGEELFELARAVWPRPK